LAVGFVPGGFAAVGTEFFTSPLAVVKRVLQLQGELQELGRYKVQYRGFFHSLHVVAKGGGILMLHKGLVPAVVLNVPNHVTQELHIEKTLERQQD
jgi:hypothetical protein